LGNLHARRYGPAKAGVSRSGANNLFSEENDRVLSPDDLPTLAVFAEVVERRSFTAAAAAVGLAKSAISRRIASLETRMGVRLLQRTTRLVSPTEEGRRLYQHCARLIAAARGADLVLSNAETGGPVRVSAPVAFAQLHLSAGVAEFLRRHPHATVHLDATDRVVDLVADGIDVAIRVGRLADSSLVARRLYSDPIVAVASPGYLTRCGAPRHESDAGRHVWLRYSTQWFGGDRLPWTTRRATRERAAGRQLVAGDAIVVCRAAVEGLGIAMLPSHVVAGEVAAGRLVRVLEHRVLPRIDVSLIHPAQRPMPARVRSLIDFLVTRFRDRAWQRRSLLTPAR
jgi:DNA-binding transcriptional LysR family regulator